MRKTIIAITGAAFLGLLAATPASAERQTPSGFVPLPVLPAVLILGAKEDPNFKAVNPYEKKVAKRHKKSKKKM
jgi:hypothetical protein